MIRMGSSDVREIDRQRINQVMDSGQFSPGPFCKEFEEKFARFVGRKHALFLNSGTDALRVALLALKEKYHWPDGSRVIVPAITFPATLNVVIQANLTPLIQDANPHLWPERMQPTPNYGQKRGMLYNVVAMIPVHMFGELAPMPGLMEFAKEHKLKVLEDSCEMVGETAGSWGDAAAFSTYQCHHLQTGVGGLAVTDDDRLNELMRSYANHGRDTAYLPGYRTPKITPQVIASRFRFERVGYSSRATEFQAALGLGQLERYDVDLIKRRAIARSLMDGLQPLHRYICFKASPDHTYMMFPLMLRSGTRFKKNRVVWELEKAGIETRDMMPITTQPVFAPYVDKYAANATKLRDLSSYTMADDINKNGFYIPCHPQMTADDVKTILKVFRTIFKGRSGGVGLTKKINSCTLRAISGKRGSSFIAFSSSRRKATPHDAWGARYARSRRVQDARQTILRPIPPRYPTGLPVRSPA